MPYVWLLMLVGLITDNTSNKPEENLARCGFDKSKMTQYFPPMLYGKLPTIAKAVVTPLIIRYDTVYLTCS